jgi:hypothetical protein
VCITFYANLGKNATETLAMIKATVQGRKHEPYTGI